MTEGPAEAIRGSRLDIDITATEDMLRWTCSCELDHRSAGRIEWRASAT